MIKPFFMIFTTYLIIQSASSTSVLSLKAHITSEKIYLQTPHEYSFAQIYEKLKNIKYIRVMYTDCKISSIRANSDVDNCIKSMRFVVENHQPSDKIEKNILIAYENTSAEQLTKTVPIMLDFKDDTITVFLRAKEPFSVIGYYFDFINQTYSMFLNDRRYFIYEAEAQKIMTKDFSLKSVTISDSDDKKVVYNSKWNNLSAKADFFVIYNDDLTISDFRVSLETPALEFKLYKENKAFKLWAKYSSQDKFSFTFIDKNLIIQNRSCRNFKNFKFVSAGLPIQSNQNFPTISIYSVKPNEVMTFYDPDLDFSLIPFSPFNHLLPVYVLNMNFLKNNLHFELHKEMKFEPALSFFINQGSTTEVRFVFTSDQGLPNAREFSINRENYEKIEFYGIYSTIQLPVQLTMNRGVLLTDSILSQTEQCAFLSASELIKEDKIINLRNKDSKFHFDYGWFKNFDQTLLDYDSLELHYEFDDQTKTLRVYLYDIRKFSLMLMNLETSISLNYQSFSQKSLKEKIVLANTDVKGLLTNENSKNPSLVLKKKADIFKFTKAKIIPITIGESYFIRVSRTMTEVLNGSPAIEVYSYNPSEISFILYDKRNTLSVKRSSNHDITIDYETNLKSITTLYGSLLTSVKFIYSSKSTICQLMPSHFIRKFNEEAASDMMLVNTLNKDFSLDSVKLLPTISKSENYISIVSTELPFLTNRQLELLFFSSDLSSCNIAETNILKFTLGFDKIIIHDSKSDKQLEYPIERLERFSEIDSASFQDQPAKLLFDLDSIQNIINSEDESSLILKRGIIYDDEDSSIRQAFFGDNFTKFNMFNQIAFSIGLDRNVIQIYYHYGLSQIKMSITDKVLTVSFNEKNKVIKKIESVECNIGGKGPKRYENIVAQLYLTNLQTISTNELIPAKESLPLISNVHVASIDHQLTFNMSVNNQPEFLQMLYTELQMISSYIMINYIETEKEKLSVVVYNRFLLELVKIHEGKLYRNSKVVKSRTSLSKNVSVVNYDSFTENIAMNFPLEANSLCRDSVCYPIKLFKTTEEDLFFILIYIEDMESISNGLSDISLEISSDSTSFMGHTITLMDNLDNLII